MKGLKTMKLSYLMMFAAVIGCGAVFAKTEVTPPTLAASPYTGSVQEATVPESANWNVVFKERGEHVGVYDIFLRLTDPDNFAWAGSDEAMITVPFEIVRAVNEWMVTPSITGWTFGETAHEPTAAAKFGGVRPVVYSGTTASGMTVANAAAVSEAGSYTATFDVAESADYTVLHKVVNFTVAKKSAGGDDFVVTVGTNPKYDGTQKTIPVTSVTFGGENIPYSVTGNKQTNAGTYQMTVTATGNYSGSKTVEWKILPRLLTMTSASITAPYTGLALSTNEVKVTGDGFAGSEGVTYTVTGSRTAVGTSENDFSYVFKTGTLAGNYQIQKVKGKITVTQAGNAWVTEPSVADKAYDALPFAPTTGSAKFGAVTVKYNGTTQAGAVITGASAVTEVGSYTAVFDVAATANYAGLHKELAFSIVRKDVTGGDFKVVVGANPKYNGAEQAIAISSVTYKGTAIPYTQTGNKGVNAGDYTLTVSASGSYTGSKTIGWKILQRSVTLTSGSASRAYTGQPLTKNSVAVSGDGFAGSEGATYTVTGSRTAVGTSENAFSYALKSGTLAGNYQIATVKGKLTVSKAGNSWTTEPGVSGKTYDGKPVSVLNGVATFGSVNTAFAPGGTTAPKNAGSYSVTFTVADCANYAGLSKSVSFTIAQRDISLVTVAGIPDQIETGSAICPTVKVTDGNPSIVTAEDFTVSYANNTAPGTATVTLTGKRNYRGTKSVTFKIIAKPVEKATLTAEAGWKLLKATGTYFAQVKVKCTDGYAAGISNLRFAFADRKDGAGKALAQLWNTQGRSAVSATTAYQGTTYRVVPLSAASITSVNVPATYGVTSLSASTIPVGERVIEMYVPKRDLPSHLGEYSACILWDSQGKTYLAPVTNTSAQ